jgi:hypothetical protein
MKLQTRKLIVVTCPRTIMQPVCGIFEEPALSMLFNATDIHVTY